MNQDILRKIPSIDQVMNTAAGQGLAERYGWDSTVDAARRMTDDIRRQLTIGERVPGEVSAESIAELASDFLTNKFAPSIRYAVNATGIILHTGLGRAMLAREAMDAVTDVIRGYCTLAADIETGQRVSRDIHYADLLCELTGAESATVMNNNAAATMIVLNSLAKGKEVIISRGQLVEIGGAFRMPDVMETSGAVMREVGTTNKTHLRDYANAINENTGAIIRVHTSNYRIVGFTEEPSIEELMRLGKEHNLPVIDDLGSGALIDLQKYGLETEPMVRRSIEAGVDVACFSGDKLIGGPQCGIIVGKSASVQKIKKNPLTRALRVGKMTAAALEATLRLFLNLDRLNELHPTYRMFSLKPDELTPPVQRVIENISEKLSEVAVVSMIDGESQVGSGSAPTETLRSKLLSIRPKKMSADALARALRKHSTPVFARIHQDAVLFDFRTIQPDEDECVEEAILAVMT